MHTGFSAYKLSAYNMRSLNGALATTGAGPFKKRKAAAQEEDFVVLA